jgi:uncharacterized membrane protein YtjA (UPF0391 family)
LSGFTGISAASADIARILFFIFVVIFLVLLVLGLLAARNVVSRGLLPRFQIRTEPDKPVGLLAAEKRRLQFWSPLH